MTAVLKYRLLYIVAEDVSLRTRGFSGRLTLLDDQLHIEGPEELQLQYSRFTQLRIIRQHKIGTVIHLQCADTSVFFSVPRFNLFGVFAIINYGRTHQLFGELQRRSGMQGK